MWSNWSPRYVPGGLAPDKARFFPGARPLRRRVKRMRKTAIVLFNLGGPDRPEVVRPFLFNLFNDPAIIDAPGPLRWLLAQTISRRRAPIARKIYQELGGGSPLLANTRAQAEALQAVLNARGGVSEFKVFIAMRYWHPMSDETARAVMAHGPDQVVLLPLYPQFSTTTTGSSVTDWTRAAAKAGLTTPTRSLCCYPTQPGFVAEVAALLRTALAEAGTEAGAEVGAEAGDGPRVLFSAHGLPKKIVARGDPYQWQVEQTAAGAEVLQLFDSWAGVWPEGALRRWCLEPAAAIVRRVKAAHPEVPIILFPRGAGLVYEVFATEAGAEGLSLDTTVPLTWARERLQGRVALQGNLDPLLLIAGGAALEAGVSTILETLGKGPLIFNLGHGITPQALPEHVEQLVAQVRAWRPGA